MINYNWQTLSYNFRTPTLGFPFFLPGSAFLSQETGHCFAFTLKKLWVRNRHSIDCIVTLKIDLRSLERNDLIWRELKRERELEGIVTWWKLLSFKIVTITLNYFLNFHIIRRTTEMLTLPLIIKHFRDTTRKLSCRTRRHKENGRLFLDLKLRCIIILYVQNFIITFITINIESCCVPPPFIPPHEEGDICEIPILIWRANWRVTN